MRVQGHRDLAMGLWNTMLCHERDTLCTSAQFPVSIGVTCPTPTSTFYTGVDVTPTPKPPTKAAPVEAARA